MNSMDGMFLPTLGSVLGLAKRRGLTYPVEAKQNEHEASGKEDQANIVNLLYQLPLRFTIFLMLRYKRRGVIEEEE